MFTPRHCGLYFAPEQIAFARQNSGKDPWNAAVARLKADNPPDAVSPLWMAFGYTFLGDAALGEAALPILERVIESGLSEDSTYLDAVAETMMAAQTFEMLREHPAFSFVRKAGWLNRFEGRVHALTASPYKESYVENLWAAALVLVSGILLEREEIFQIGVEVFQETVDHDIRPQGFIPKALEGADGAAMYRQIAASAALTLMAEAAGHAGVDLWRYENRGISATTAALYPIYYFYTTEKWMWDKDLPPEDVQNWFRRYAGYLEIVKARTGHRDLNPLLEDLRPIFTPLAGGLTTLSHGAPLRRRGLFG
ncbi:MAG: alginate lyase family protein [Anaerolineae bacterium]|nr:alginate lyase family protein [Anaerolineae bacterium]